MLKDQDQRGQGSTTEKNSEDSSIMEIENVILAKMHDDEEDNSDAIFKSEKFHQDLFFMEQVIMENIFQPKLAAYHQLPILKEPEPEEPEDLLEGEKVEEVEEEVKREEEEEIEIDAEQSIIPANLERLWSFSCDLTKSLNVSSLAWNKTNPDLLAVGYGHCGFKERKKGLACCWSIKNPMAWGIVGLAVLVGKGLPAGPTDRTTFPSAGESGVFEDIVALESS
ncbi:dynein axonemal intermediate chain 4-like [Molossus nigricans]